MSSIRYPSRATFTVNQQSLSELIVMLSSEDLKIPEHQREYVWNLVKEARLVETVLNGLPMPSVMIREDGRGSTAVKSLEDGQQRLTCLRKYREDKFAVVAEKGKEGKLYSELTDMQRHLFDTYPVPVLTYRGLTQEETIRAFDNFQNGTPLSTGERYHSLMGISPLIKLSKDLLLTKGSGFHDRAEGVWGAHEGIGKRGLNLVNAVALVASLAFGSDKPCYISKKWAEMSEVIAKTDLTGAVIDKVKSRIDTILSIYEEVQKVAPLLTKTELKHQWNLGTFTGYIAYSLIRFPSDTARLKSGWINYLKEVRTYRPRHKDTKGVAKMKEAILIKLHRDMALTRTWEEKRWMAGYMRVFEPDMADEYIRLGDASTDCSTEASDDEYEE